MLNNYKNLVFEGGGVKGIAYGGALDILGATSDLWKAGVLLRIGYPIRNGVDSQLRIWATVGALTSLRHTAGGIKRLTQNTRAKGQRLVDKIDSVGKAEYATIKKELQTQGATRAKLQKEIEVTCYEWKQKLQVTSRCSSLEARTASKTSERSAAE